MFIVQAFKRKGRGIILDELICTDYCNVSTNL
jgi:hypothetical protein